MCNIKQKGFLKNYIEDDNLHFINKKELFAFDDKNEYYAYGTKKEYFAYPIREYGLFGGRKSKKEKNITREKTINNMTKIMNTVSTEIMMKNEQSFKTMISQKNKLTFENITCDTLKISGISQTNDATLDEDTKMESINTTEINNDIGSVISGAFKNEKTKEGTNFGDVAGAAIGALGDTVTAGMDNVFGGSSSSKTNITDRQTFNIETETTNELENVINDETIQEAITSTAQENEAEFKNIKCGDGEISDVAQKNVLKATIKKIANSEKMQKAAANVVDKIDNHIENMEKDIGDTAVIADGVVEGIGALGDAAEQTIDASGDAAAGVITAGGNAASKLFLILVIGGIALAAIAAYFLMSPAGQSATSQALDKVPAGGMGKRGGGKSFKK